MIYIKISWYEKILFYKCRYIIYIKRASNIPDYLSNLKMKEGFSRKLPPILNIARENDLVRSRIQEKVFWHVKEPFTGNSGCN